jgi:alpha-tubulin suppressor-like RCC1 family protein
MRRSVPPGTAERIELPVTPREVVTGTGSTCILDEAGAVWCWGRNAYGQFGTGFAASNTYHGPTKLSVPGRIVTLRTGSAATCAIADDGALWCWGRIDGLARSPYRFAPGTRFSDVTLSNRDAYTPQWSTVCGLATTGRAYCSRWMR